MRPIRPPHSAATIRHGFVLLLLAAVAAGDDEIEVRRRCDHKHLKPRLAGAQASVAGSAVNHGCAGMMRAVSMTSALPVVGDVAV